MLFLACMIPKIEDSVSSDTTWPRAFLQTLPDALFRSPVNPPRKNRASLFRNPLR